MELVRVYHPNDRIHTYEKVGCNLYNGYTHDEVLARTTFLGRFQDKYMNNVRRYIEIQMSGLNLHELESIRNYNFGLIKWFNKLNG